MDEAKMDRLLAATEAFVNAVANEWQQWTVTDQFNMIFDMMKREKDDPGARRLLDVLRVMPRIFAQWELEQ